MSITAQMYVIVLTTGEYDTLQNTVEYVTYDLAKGTTYVNEMNTLHTSIFQKMATEYLAAEKMWRKENENLYNSDRLTLNQKIAEFKQTWVKANLTEKELELYEKKLQYPKWDIEPVKLLT